MNMKNYTPAEAARVAELVALGVTPEVADRVEFLVRCGIPTERALLSVRCMDVRLETVSRPRAEFRAEVQSR